MQMLVISLKERGNKGRKRAYKTIIRNLEPSNLTSQNGYRKFIPAGRMGDPLQDQKPLRKRRHQNHHMQICILKTAARAKLIKNLKPKINEIHVHKIKEFVASQQIKAGFSASINEINIEKPKQRDQRKKFKN